MNSGSILVALLLGAVGGKGGQNLLGCVRAESGKGKQDSFRQFTDVSGKVDKAAGVEFESSERQRNAGPCWTVHRYEL
ncbi:hypothetical protein NDU88_007039 [Pleurodeles waltl]|uniref:Secreted protein n=1 Tax=Pleurodeles waltl TaxID=8319 RepID=A0AAV7PN51_PLEWA|nr:hypothetical protein NDU88_007039 [Pleurodeles waltl]